MRSGPLFFSVATLLIASCGGGGGSGGPGGSGAQNGDDIGRTPGCFFADYPRAKTSEYVLPFQVGMTYPLGQGNCGRFTHQLECFASGRPCGDHRYSYDFQMPIGTVALAARSGEITSVVMRFADGNRTGGQANYISIRHDDGSVGRYLHLSFSSAMVMVGQRVLQGDPIALSSDTGIADGDKHLHFDVVVFEGDTCRVNIDFSNCATVPVTFSNASPLDEPPLEGRSYTAL